MGSGSNDSSGSSSSSSSSMKSLSGPGHSAAGEDEPAAVMQAKGDLAEVRHEIASTGLTADDCL
jgi:hypothetical protein